MQNKTILVTVSDDRSGRKGGQYEATQNKVTKIFIRNRFVDEQQPWTISSIINSDSEKVNEFYQENKMMLDSPDAAINGRLYKPFAIKMGLDTLEEGDYLIYNDVSPEMWPMSEKFEIDKGVYSIDIIQELCRSANNFLVAFVKWSPNNFNEFPLGIHTHRYFTTKLCLETMNAVDYIDSYLCASGMICIRKTQETVNIVEEWLIWNKKPECASIGFDNYPKEDDDTEFWKNLPGEKLGCRHDQSILSIILNKRNWSYVDIVYNDISPYNFLNFCRKDINYSFINSNIKIK